jgi:hypothetical protein
MPCIEITIIPLRTGESSLGVQTPLPRQKTTFGHYHSYRLIMPIEKERRRDSMMYLTFKFVHAAPIHKFQTVPAMDDKRQTTISYSNGLDKINLSMKD